MMQQPTHQPPAHIAAATAMGGHPGGNPFALGPIQQLHQTESQQKGQGSVSKSPPVSHDGPASNLRKRKTPPPTSADEDENEDETLTQMPPLQQALSGAPSTQGMEEPPQPRMTAQQSMIHPQSGHLHPPFHYPVPAGYVPVMPVPVGDPNMHQSGAGGPNRVLNGSKRAEQNRKAQRAFRERRDAHVKALESRSQLLDAALASVDEANRRWEEARQMCESLRLENQQLRAALNAFQQAGTAIVQMQQLAQSAQQNQDEQKQGNAATQAQEQARPSGDTSTEGEKAEEDKEAA